nr:retrovirus-related Pol polyprotein from transposon TNT 1-94 [Tanacetum cinerariifolium]
CPVTILNTLEPLGKFDGKADEGFLVGYSVSSKALRVFNSRTIIFQETLHINFLENQPNVAGSGLTWLFDIDTFTQSMNYQPVVAGNQPNSSAGIQETLNAGSGLTWLFDIDTLTQSMNYQPVVAGNQPNSSAGIQETLNAGIVGKEATSVQQYVLLPLWSFGSKDPQNTDNVAFEVKEPESTVYVSPSSYDKTTKHDDKTKREAKDKIPVEFSTGVRDLSDNLKNFLITALTGLMLPVLQLLLLG